MSRVSAVMPSRAPASTEAPVVAAQGLTKVFRDFWMRSRVRAVDSIDLQVRRGEIFGLLGPNGSGKSTTIKMILGLLHKSGGRLAVFGKNPSDVSIKSRIGYLPEESYLYPFLDARETLDYYAKLFQLGRATRQRRIDELLDMVGLAAVQRRQVREYSKGMQRRIGIAQALINDPEFLILDEPTTGLDPIGARQIKDLILDLGRRGKTILLSSHQLSDVEDCVDRMVILYGGKIRAEGSCDELLTAGDKTVIETDALDPAEVEALDRYLQEQTGHVVRRISKPRQRLEDLFLDIVDRARTDRVETSGAQAGGPTAAFLRGDDAPADGESLIQRLVEGEPAPRAPEPAPSVAEEAQPAGPDESVIGDLVERKEPDAAPSKDRAPDAPRAPAKPRADVDLSVIDSLTRDDDEGAGAEPRR